MHGVCVRVCGGGGWGGGVGVCEGGGVYMCVFDIFLYHVYGHMKTRYKNL